MKDSIMVSFVIPFFNSGKYLKKCVDSILKMTDVDFEILLINDGSDDDSIKYANNIVKGNESIIKLYDNSHNGVSFQRNFGIKQSRGDYICFIDSDDFIRTDNLFKILGLITKKDDLIITDLNNLNGPVTAETIKSQDLVKRYFPLYGKDSIHLLHGKIFKKTFLDDHNISFEENVKVGEDLIFNLDVIEKNPNIKYINLNYYNYDISDVSVSTKYNGNIGYDKKEIFSKLKSIYEKYELNCNELYIIKVKMFYAIMLNEFYYNPKPSLVIRKKRIMMKLWINGYMNLENSKYYYFLYKMIFVNDLLFYTLLSLMHIIRKVRRSV